MNAAMRDRLVGFARAEIERHVNQMRVRAGRGVTEAEGMLGLIERPGLRPDEAEPETWVLAIYAEKTTHDSVTGTLTSPLQAVAFVPRSSGIPAVTDLIWWEKTQMRDGDEPPSTKTVSIQFYTRRFDPWPGSFPLPDWESGRPYGGTVTLTLGESELTEGSTVTTHEVVIPPEGTGVLSFTVSPLVPANTVTELRPLSVARVRT